MTKVRVLVEEEYIERVRTEIVFETSEGDSEKISMILKQASLESKTVDNVVSKLDNVVSKLENSGCKVLDITPDEFSGTMIYGIDICDYNILEENLEGEEVIYSSEQLERMTDSELSVLVAKSMGWVLKSDGWYLHLPSGTWYMASDSWNPAVDVVDSRKVQSEAMKRSISRYLDNLCPFVSREATDYWHDDCIALMLKATPRQVTIAAILTFQGGKTE